MRFEPDTVPSPLKRVDQSPAVLVLGADHRHSHAGDGELVDHLGGPGAHSVCVGWHRTGLCLQLAAETFWFG